MDYIIKTKQFLDKQDWKKVQQTMTELSQKLGQQAGPAAEQLKVDLLQKGGHVLLVEFLKNENVFIHLLALFVLLSLSTNVDICKVFGKDESIVDTVIQCLAVNKEPQVQLYGTMFLRNMSRVTSVKQSMIEGGSASQAIVEMVVDGADEGVLEDKQQQQVVTNAVATLGSLASMLNAFQSADAPQDQQDYAEELIVQLGCAFGANKALCGLLKTVANMPAAHEVIGVELVQMVFQALQFLVLATQNAKQVYSMDIVKLTNTVIEKPKFRDNRNLAKQGSTLLQVLTLNDDLVAEMGSGGAGGGNGSDGGGGGDDGNDQLAKLIADAKSGNPDKQNSALGFMWNLANHPANQAVMRERGVLELVCQALKTAQYVENLESAAGLMSALAANPQNAEILGSYDAIPLLARLLAVKDEPQLLQNALSAFGCLSLIPANRIEVLELGLLKRFIMLLPQKNLATRTKEFLVKIMVLMSHQDRRRIQDEGGLDALIALLNDESNPMSVRSDVCAALWNLQNDDEISAYLREKDVYDTMITMLAQTDLNKTSDVLMQEQAGMGEDALRKAASKDVAGFDFAKFEQEMATLRKLEQDMRIDLDDMDADDGDELRPSDYTSDMDQSETELTPADAELEPATDVEDELKPEDAAAAAGDNGEELKPEVDDQGEQELKPADDGDAQKQQPTKRQDTTAIMKKKQEEFLKKKEEKRKEIAEAKAQKQQVDDEAVKRQAKRNRICKELLETETAYVDSLIKVEHLFMKPLQNELSHLMGKAEFKVIFSDVLQIQRINQAFCTELKLLFTEKGDPKNPATIEHDIGTLILRRAPTFKLYTNYVNQYDLADATLQQQIKSSKKFAEFLEKTAMSLFDQGCRQTDLGSFLIMPIQRLPRYNLLLSDLIKHSDSEGKTSYAMLKNAIAQIQAITAYVNETKRQAENKQLVKELSRKLNIKNLVTSHRSLRKTIQDMDFVTYERNRPTATRSKVTKGKVFVCNDVILVCKKAAVSGKLITMPFPLKSAKINKAIADQDREGLRITMENVEARFENELDLTKEVLELKFADKASRDGFFTEIRQLQSEML